MTRLFTILTLGTALPLCAQSQPQPSLGEVARQLREQHDKNAKTASKVFTNDNLPAPAPWEAVNSQVAQPSKGEKPSAPAEMTAEPAKPLSPQETTNQKPDSAPPKTREDWQAKFKAAHQDLSNAEKMQQLSEDELNLLEIQQTQQIDPGAKAELADKVQSKQAEVDTHKAATEAAQKALADLEKEFKASGAPDDWSQTD
jgi:hypothetical protein